MIRFISQCTFLALVTCYLPQFAFANSSGAELEQALSVRHLSLSSQYIESLEQRFGGREAFVDSLIKLSRSEDGQPHACLRAAHILAAHYANDSSVAGNVVEAMAEDLQSDRAGLARLYAKSLLSINNLEHQKQLAKIIATRASQQPAFAPYAKQLRTAASPEVRSILEGSSAK